MGVRAEGGREELEQRTWLRAKVYQPTSLALKGASLEMIRSRGMSRKQAQRMKYSQRTLLRAGTHARLTTQASGAPSRRS